MTTRATPILILVACLLAGCFDVQQQLTLERNLSGKAGFSMTVDMEPFAVFMLRFAREMQGQKGEPTAEEIEQAKREFLASKKQTPEPDREAQRGELEQSLPPGVRLLESRAEAQGLKVGVRVVFGFDHVSKLSQIKLPSEKSEQPGPKNPFERPFGGLKVVDEGRTLLLVSEATNPMAKPAEAGGSQPGPMPGPEMAKLVEEAFKSFRIVFKLDTPLEVVESNATRRQGRTLYWEYDFEAVKKMSPEQTAEGIRVRLRK